MIKERAEGLMSGKISRFGPEQMSMMKDQLFQDTMGQVKQQVRAMDGSLARRGMFRSGLAARAESDIRRAGITAYSRGIKDILLKKMNAEFEDKNEGLKMAQSYVTGQQNYQLGRERNQIAREQISAQLSIAAMQNKTARAGIAAANGRANAALRFSKEQAAVSQARFMMGQGQFYSPEGADMRQGGNFGRSLPS
jgi:hypothetical protein